MRNKFVLYSFYIVCIGFSHICLGQYSIDSILIKYQKYAQLPKEIVYVHLNKSTFIEGEELGFTAYVFDKSTKKLSLLTKNLYCSLTNEENKVVNSKLLKVTNGIATNTFKIDSTFTLGTYKFRAFTNWMQNFKERNYYEDIIQVVDPYQINLNVLAPNNDYELQVVPEGGQFLSNTFNNAGIILQNNLGIGLANKDGFIVDENNTTVSTFTTNEFGLAKCIFFAETAKTYNAIVNLENEKTVSKPIKITPLGVNMVLKKHRDFYVASIKTNHEVDDGLNKKLFFLAIHNGTQLKIREFIIDEKEKNQLIKNEDLYEGINIFTLLDASNLQPVSERMIFNRSSSKPIQIKKSSYKIEQDSITITLEFDKKIDSLTNYQNVSVSILPVNTKAHFFTNTILTQSLLLPYLKSYVHNADVYFKDTDTATDYKLDLLLLTQGNSSFNWYDVINKPLIKHPFENGIDVVANKNEDGAKQYMVYPLKQSGLQFFNLSAKDESFLQKALFPEDKEELIISAITKKGGANKPKLYLQFYPNSIPKFTTINYTIPTYFKYSSKNTSEKNTNIIIPKKDVIELDEVVIKANLEQKRREKILKENSWGKVTFFDDAMRGRFMTLASFLSERGYDARDYSGILTIRDLRPNTPNNNTPLVILDDVYLSDFSFLGRYTLENIDYIMIDRVGIGYGIRGGGGVIKIKSDPLAMLRNSPSNANNIQNYKFPVRFAKEAKYKAVEYNPNNILSKRIGAIDWKPKIDLISNESIQFKIAKPFVEVITLFIEGIINSSKLSTKININLEQGF